MEKMHTPPSSERKLVSVRQISRIERVAHSDRVAVHVDGWSVLIKRRRPTYQVSSRCPYILPFGPIATVSTFKPDVQLCQVGDLVVYFEIDSFIPKTDRFWELFVDPSATEVFRGRQGFRVKTRQRGTHVSQGLIYPLADFPEIKLPYEDRIKAVGRNAATAELFSQSFASLLGVEKWEYTEKAVSLPNLGPPPGFIRLPRWQRIQDMERSIFSHPKRRKVWQITEKLDGVTMMVYKLARDSRWAECLPALPADCPPTMQDDKNRYGVCSRYEDLIDRDTCLYWQAARTSGVLGKLSDFGLSNFAVQGELCGSSIEGNTMNYPDGEHEFVVFSIWDIDSLRYLHARHTAEICSKLGIKHVPVIGYSSMDGYARDLHELLARADGTGRFGGIREGLVFKSLDGQDQFKVISNRWLSLTGK